jgi:hypothetical protein
MLWCLQTLESSAPSWGRNCRIPGKWHSIVKLLVGSAFEESCGAILFNFFKEATEMTKRERAALVRKLIKPEDQDRYKIVRQKTEERIRGRQLAPNTNIEEVIDVLAILETLIPSSRFKQPSLGTKPKPTSSQN